MLLAPNVQHTAEDRIPRIAANVTQQTEKKADVACRSISVEDT